MAADDAPVSIKIVPLVGAPPACFGMTEADLAEAFREAGFDFSEAEREVPDYDPEDLNISFPSLDLHLHLSLCPDGQHRLNCIEIFVSDNVRLLLWDCDLRTEKAEAVLARGMAEWEDVIEIGIGERRIEVRAHVLTIYEEAGRITSVGLRHAGWPGGYPEPF